MGFKSKICTCIKILRQKSGKNQEGFAEFCNVNYDSYRKWETGKNMPSADSIDKICKANNIDIVNLLLLDDKLSKDKLKIIDDIINKLHLLIK